MDYPIHLVYKYVWDKCITVKMVKASIGVHLHGTKGADTSYCTCANYVTIFLRVGMTFQYS